MTALRQVGKLDPNFGWTGNGRIAAESFGLDRNIPEHLLGAYTCVHREAQGIRLVRDLLGINKLFWATAPDGTLLVAARPRQLVDAGCAFEAIAAIAPGSVVDLDLRDGGVRVRALRTGTWPPAPLPDGAAGSVEAAAERIRDALHAYCAALAEAHAGAAAFVCLSGGLDSTGVAVLARRYFRDVVAVSFDLERRGGAPSADRRAAEQLARDLGLGLLTVTVSEDELLDGLDVALVEGIDWRDFNVHAALVNVALARGIAESRQEADTRPALVLTGDLSNEYISDYHPETYRGHTYYPLPRLGPAALQRALVRGLDTSHREIGPFQAWRLPVAQPYAVVVDHYLALPEAFLAEPARKDRLSRLVFGDAIPDYVYARPKTRAQVGDAETGRGVLAVCVDRGIDAAWLRRRFGELHGIADPGALPRFIRAGRYRSAVPEVWNRP